MKLWNLILYILKYFGTGRFPPGMKPGIKPATFEVTNDLKQIISQKDNQILQKAFVIYADQEVDEWNFAIASTELHQEH